MKAMAANADRHAATLLPFIGEIQRTDTTTLRAIAEALNARGVPTARGSRFDVALQNAPPVAPCERIRR